MLTDSVDAPLPTALVLAAANSLIVLDGKVFGDPLERAALDWSTDDAGAAAWELKRNGRVSSPSLGVTASNVARHHFDSVVKRMSVIANLEGKDEAWVG
jgi:magnesium-transporting ATPase (P-type)